MEDNFRKELEDVRIKTAGYENIYVDCPYCNEVPRQNYLSNAGFF